ncbi:hypothetical protein [Bailinhaonella thermotolerans]|uniref:hypothetical protein n=1 Tax=Bailinhaonella thermotolerans TaxID=1070861 RepID=UPI0011C3C87C|nr:hypothetical protein [Bailinhaonella thermotolerans]
MAAQSAHHRAKSAQLWLGGLLATTRITALLKWKVSFHATVTADAVAFLIVQIGPWPAVTAPLVPLIG